jgi:hypothetical protein
VLIMIPGQPSRLPWIQLNPGPLGDNCFPVRIPGGKQNPPGWPRSTRER